jgi:hypothetical protein
MARDMIDLTPIETRRELIEWFETGIKPESQFRIGTEHEKFPFYATTHRPVGYEGPRGIRALLEGMQALLGWEPILENGLPIGLFDVTGGGAISLEPGGQFELSGAPLETIHQTCVELGAHLAQLKQVADPLGIRFLGIGMSPLWTLAETPVMPKSRYKIMRAYMPKVGTRGLDMMFRTSTVQVNLDFSSEAVTRFFPKLATRLEYGDLFELIERKRASGVAFDVLVCNNVLEHVREPERMVRNLVGSLMLIGKGEQPVDWMKTLLDGKDRTVAGPTAPAEGLMFLGALYPPEWDLPDAVTLK